MRSRWRFPCPATRGSVLYLFDGHLLFSGDSLAAEPDGSGLIAFRDACWYSWPTQHASLARFAQSEYRFDRLFCGHGWSRDGDQQELHDDLIDLCSQMLDD